MKLSLLSSRHFYKGKWGKIVEWQRRTWHQPSLSSQPHAKALRQWDFTVQVASADESLSKLHPRIAKGYKFIVRGTPHSYVQISQSPSSCSFLSKIGSTPHWFIFSKLLSQRSRLKLSIASFLPRAPIRRGSLTDVFCQAIENFETAEKKTLIIKSYRPVKNCLY